MAPIRRGVKASLETSKPVKFTMRFGFGFWFGFGIGWFSPRTKVKGKDWATYRRTYCKWRSMRPAKSSVCVSPLELMHLLCAWMHECINEWVSANHILAGTSRQSKIPPLMSSLPHMWFCTSFTMAGLPVAGVVECRLCRVLSVSRERVSELVMSQSHNP